MTLAEAVAVLRAVADHPPESTAWALSDGYLQADWRAPDIDTRDRIISALYQLGEAAMVVLTELERRRIPTIGELAGHGTGVPTLDILDDTTEADG